MGKGTTFESEISTFNDSISGVQITKLTNYLTHNFHTYFTNNGWYDQNKKLLIGSDRGNCTNLYSMELETGMLTQLTEFTKEDVAGVQGTYINPQKNEAYFTKNNTIVALNLDSLEEEEIYTSPEGYNLSNLSCTADGKHLAFGLSEDLSHRIKSNLGGGYIGFEEIEAARPHSQICLLSLETKENEVVHEENRWIGHVNVSPTQSHLLSFCHEGPWEKVDHRIWLLDLQSKKVWKIRDGHPNQFAGHEYWHADGLHIGYHGFTESLTRKDGKFLGSIKYDNTNRKEYDFPYQNMHIHSNDESLIVGDGQQASAYHGETYKDCIFLWNKVEGRMGGPRILCKHRGSFQTQKVHVHPKLSPDKSQVLFTSDMDGYGNVYLAHIPPLESLPLLTDLLKNN
ncbi:oligogalacturonide lyase [Evansella vedderi]|uniref:Oligogalacturonide lyase n=1 Tax=Evansella vedderi TaxID=38282 RepID=A0ABU0A1I0_9BACI|nr:oligogalacturonate lyase family protein [Evansella vedderi]MDQ0257347.1 oligogalacturonide lyase [Evansella vedderi]